jgi:CRP-like cAMP-binding protein
VEELTGHSVERRIASTLLKLAAKFGEQQGDSVLIGMPLSHQDIAELTGTVRETASRVLSQFKAAGLIEAGHRWMAVKDSGQLRQVAAGTADPAA